MWKYTNKIIINNKCYIYILRDGGSERGGKFYSWVASDNMS